MSLPAEANYLGFDVGSKRIGVAIASSITVTASPLAIVASNGSMTGELDTLIDAFAPTALIVGLPLDTQGREMCFAPQAKRFFRLLERRYQLPLHWVNECYTTRLAQAFCRQQRSKRGKHQMDDIAAAIILQSWLNSMASE